MLFKGLKIGDTFRETQSEFGELFMKCQDLHARIFAIGMDDKFGTRGFVVNAEFDPDDEVEKVE